MNIVVDLLKDTKLIPISRGRTSLVYRIGEAGEYVFKEFSPNLFARSWHNFFYWSEHHLASEAGIAHAYWKRRLANRLSRGAGDDVVIVDAVARTQFGIITPFIQGEHPSRRQLAQVHARTKPLEQLFDDIGMPNQSFRMDYLMPRRKNVIMRGGRICVIDYEQSVPLPDSRGAIGYDLIYFDDLHRFVKDKRISIKDKLGTAEMKSLDEAFAMARETQDVLYFELRRAGKYSTKLTRPLSKKAMEAAVERLYVEGKISDQERQDYLTGSTGENIRHAAIHLAVHMTIGVVTPPFILSLPSAGARLAWTMANWGYNTAKGNERKKLHNWRVMAVCAMPLPFPASAVSNGAYILAITEENPQIGLAMCDNLLYEQTGRTLPEVMAKIGSKVPTFTRGYDAAYHRLLRVPGLRRIPGIAMGQNTQKAHDVLLDYMMKGAYAK